MQELIIQFTASFLIFGMYAGIFLLWVIDGKIKKEQALHALLASALSWIAAGMLKDLFHTPRPFLLNSLPTKVFMTPIDGAFPSAHAATAFAMATTIWLHDKKWGIAYLSMALLIGIARVVGNVHFPVDILGGAVLGSAVALTIERLHLFKFLSGKSKKK
ncbi:MAG: phosphatase PAP2 family protein [Patescibacteria group bacterium]